MTDVISPRPSDPRAIWRSLDELAGTAAFADLLAHEFPALAADPGMSRGGLAGRRRFLASLAASLAFAAAGGRRASADDGSVDRHGLLVPFVRQPLSAIPSAPVVFSSAVLVDGFANGVNVTTRNGRPIKIEGNPAHPWSRGGTDIFGQSAVLGFYDPDRSQSVRQFGRETGWPDFQAALVGIVAGLQATHGEGFRLVTGPITSPTLLRQISALRTALPGMRWHMHVPSGRLATYRGTEAAFGRRLETRTRLSEARVVVALDGDLLDFGPHQVGTAERWAAARRGAAARGTLLALHAAGAAPSLTSAKADFPATVPASAMPALVAALASAASGGAVPDGAPVADWTRRAGAALHAAGSAGVVVAGAAAAPPLLAAVHRMNAASGAAGRSVLYTEAVLPEAASIASLVDDIGAGRVSSVLVLGANPAYDTPASLGFTDAFRRVPLKIHAGLHEDETGARSDWHLPLSHPLEQWGDARAFDGTASLMQPTIAPLYGTRSESEILAMFAAPAAPAPDGEKPLRETWALDDDAWQQCLLDGFVAKSAFPGMVPSPSSTSPQPASPAPAASSAGSGVTLLVQPDASVWDGSVANNGWLQELPRPLTKITWRNVVTVGPGFAAREGWSIGDNVVVAANGREIEGAVWILPGHADDAVSLTLGYGRSAGGAVCDGLGYDAYAILPRDGTMRIDGATIRRGTGRTTIATTQEHGAIRGGDLVRVQAIGSTPVGQGHQPIQPTFYGKLPTDGRSWGMVIDLDSCIGCNACVVACQSENNIPVVGEEQVAIGREMHWLRIDRYYEGPVADPATHFMPVPCMHCEDAPCEVGCPVEATLHDHEGVNLMVYNRCVGTRACSGYCPYKVRHFNYLDYNAGMAPSIEASRNPDVTVRARGVMEKCNYCIQRIAEARIESDRDDTPIADGVVRTACQQGCPTNAITFGDLEDTSSRVRTLTGDPRNYALLGELGLRPHTTYLASLAPSDPGGEKS